MIELIAHNLAPIMFFSMVGFLLFGYPIAFALAANGLLFFFFGVFLTPLSDQINLGWNLLGALGDRVFGVMRNDTLLAIPFFTFMGIVLERSRMAEELLDTIGQLFGPIRGGLAYAVILVGALPTWGYSGGWGYFPSGGLGLILLVVIILLVLGRI